jgi:hypothetical protein
VVHGLMRKEGIGCRFNATIGGHRRLWVASSGGIVPSMSVISIVQTNKPPVLYFPFPITISFDVYDYALFSQNNSPMFMLVFNKIKIGNYYLGIVWPSFFLRIIL